MMWTIGIFHVMHGFLSRAELLTCLSIVTMHCPDLDHDGHCLRQCQRHAYS